MAEHQVRAEGIEILRVLCGSRAYGLEQNASDYDYHGVYVVPTTRLLSIGPPVKETAWIEGEDQDNTAWEIGHFLKLSVYCNPTVLETYVAPIVGTPAQSGQMLRDLFPHVLSRKRVYDAFRGYASNQRKKMFEPPPGVQAVDRMIKAAVAYLRSLYHGVELLLEGTYSPRLAEGWFKYELMDIRQAAKPNLARVVEIAMELEDNITKAYLHSEMPTDADVEKVNEFLLSVRKVHWTA